MRHLKTYNESLFKRKEGIDINTIRDILIDLEDVGLDAIITKDHNASFDPASGGHKEIPDPIVKDDLLIVIKKPNFKHDGPWTAGMGTTPNLFFNTSITKDCIDRVFNYIKQTGTKIENIEFSYGSGEKIRGGYRQFKANGFVPDRNVDCIRIHFSIRSFRHLLPSWWKKESSPKVLSRRN